MIINRDNKHEFEKLDLHDAELIDINCDYRSQTVLVSTKLHNSIQKGILLCLTFKEISFISVSCEEPWGSGFYVLGTTIDDELNGVADLDDENRKLTFNIILNSGDQIKIESSRVEINQC